MQEKSYGHPQLYSGHTKSTNVIGDSFKDGYMEPHIKTNDQDQRSQHTIYAKPSSATRIRNKRDNDISRNYNHPRRKAIQEDTRSSTLNRALHDGTLCIGTTKSEISSDGYRTAKSATIQNN